MIYHTSISIISVLISVILTFNLLGIGLISKYEVSHTSSESRVFIYVYVRDVNRVFLMAFLI